VELSFALHGVLRVQRAFSAARAAEMRDALWRAFAERYGIDRDDRASWRTSRPAGLQALTQMDAFAFPTGETLCTAVDALLVAGHWRAPTHWGAPLVTFPTPPPWSIPTDAWHLDFPAYRHAAAVPGLRVLGFANDVGRHGGGTLAVAGSHRLVERYAERAAPDAVRSKDVRRALAAQHAWLELLWQRDAGSRVEQLERGTRIDGIDVRVIELTGAPGDVVLMHPWTLHTAAPNCAAMPRLMVSQAIVRDSFRRHFAAETQL
jgi:ectoine hydroxylase-related dioxygenase (phytanoyl-CoA dioxygenase family)